MFLATIVTCYHFSKSRAEDYHRLIQSICESLTELRENGKVVLVANGQEATPLSEVTADVAKRLTTPSLATNVVPISLQKNIENTGALNAGVLEAVKQNSEWIASVQSSAVLKPGWLQKLTSLKSNNQGVVGAFGRLLKESDDSVIYSDGHYMREGRTWDKNQKRPISSAHIREFGTFPCLSAAIFRSDAVKNVIAHFGNFVCHRLPKYGDCTDVALRIKSIRPESSFEFVEGATALKRWPTIDKERAYASQIVAARFYFGHDRFHESIERIRVRSGEHLAAAITIANECCSGRYSPNLTPPPRGSLLDEAW